VIAVDTNVLVRFLVGDDARQSPLARRLLKGGNCLLLGTALQETVWVLESLYTTDRSQIADALEKLLNIEGTTLEVPQLAHVAQWYRDGMDFADAVHLAMATSHQCEKLATFDASFVKQARGRTGCKVMQPG
jgi:predicted nucleic-acid-binding protein